MSDTADPPRWKEGPPGADRPQDRAAAMSRAIGAPEPPSDVAVARLRARILQRTARPSRRRWLPAVAALALAFSGGAALAFWWSRPRAPTAPVATAPERRPTPRPASPRVLAPVAPARTAAPQPVRELDLLRRAPRAVLEGLRGDPLNDEGMTVHNRRGFACSGNQRFALESMTTGAALRRPELIEQGWQAIDTTFRYQADDGSFLDGALCTSYWLSHLAHALLVLGESAEAQGSADRVRALLPRIARAARWLSSAEQRTALDESARDFPSRMLYHATAFGLTGRLLGDESLEAVGADYAAQALALQRPDGTFAMQPPLDSMYQGSVLWKLSWYALRFPDARVDEALRRGGRWLLTRIEPDGTFDLSDTAAVPLGKGEIRRVANLTEVAWGLVYFGTRFDDGEALSAAGRLLARNRARLQRR